MSDTAFIRRILALAELYRINNRKKKVKYDLDECNCSSWVYSVLLVAGIPKKILWEAGEFSGWDWAEEEEIDKELFHPHPPKPKTP